MSLLDSDLEHARQGLQDTQARKGTVSVNLPTDEDLASKGLAEWEKLIASLPEELAAKAKGNEDLLGVYCGIYPEIGERSGFLLSRPINLEQTAILINAINNNGWAKVIMHAHLGYSIVNKEAVIRVIMNNRDYFPLEAFADPVSWLSNNQTQWNLGPWTDLKEVRYGLLSGFPVNACRKYVAYHHARKKLINNVLPGETMKEAIFLTYLVMYGRDAGSSYSADELGRFSEIVRNKGNDLIADGEISLWAQLHGVSIGDGGGFLGFDESDDEWVAAANLLFRKVKDACSFVSRDHEEC